MAQALRQPETQKKPVLAHFVCRGQRQVRNTHAPPRPAGHQPGTGVAQKRAPFKCGSHGAPSHSLSCAGQTTNKTTTNPIRSSRMLGHYFCDAVAPIWASSDCPAWNTRAAFALAQMNCFWLVQQGLIPKTQAEQMLSQAIRANAAGDDDDQLAAAKLTAVLQSIQVFQPPVQH